LVPLVVKSVELPPVVPILTGSVCAKCWSLGNGVPVGVGVGVAVVLVLELPPPQPIRTTRIKQAQRVFSTFIVVSFPFSAPGAECRNLSVKKNQSQVVWLDAGRQGHREGAWTLVTGGADRWNRGSRNHTRNQVIGFRLVIPNEEKNLLSSCRFRAIPLRSRCDSARLSDVFVEVFQILARGDHKLEPFCGRERGTAERESAGEILSAKARRIPTRYLR
jgi:hypothetical protein